MGNNKFLKVSRAESRDNCVKMQNVKVKSKKINTQAKYKYLHIF